MTDTNSAEGATPPPLSGLKIAILGSAPVHRMLAPFDMPEWEIWACSANNFAEGKCVLPRVDAWFELHSLARKRAQFPGFVDYLKTQPRVYIQQPDPEFPNAIIYPVQDVFAQFDPELFVSSVAYMIGFAILQKPAEIGIWGVDLCTRHEYAEQRLGTRLMIKEAERRGIRVVGPAQTSMLVPAPQYAYCEGWNMYWALVAREEMYQQRIQQLEKTQQETNNEIATLVGAKEEVFMCRKTWLQPRRP